jgi:fructoselysine and glucoselysine-specific PTS system IIB component
LLHGQVAFAWTSYLGADCILVASDAVMTDQIRKTTIKLCKPNGVKLVIKNIEDSIKAINSGVTDKYNLLIVVESIKDAARLAENCSQVKSINLGGIKKKDNTTKWGNAVFVTDEEIEIVKEMVGNNIEVEIRQIPSESSVNVKKIISKK